MHRECLANRLWRAAVIALCGAATVHVGCSGEDARPVVARADALGASEIDSAVMAGEGSDVGEKDAGSRSMPSRVTGEAGLFRLYHQQWIEGELLAVQRGLHALLDREEAPVQVRGEAGLRLAEIAELRGERRESLAVLGRVIAIVGQENPLSRRANEWRQRIRSAVPLAEVPGPAPGSVLLKNEAPAVVSAFRRAEKGLVAFHRVLVAPRLENVDAVLRNKRQALEGALKAYRQVVEDGRPPARAAAHFRMGSMYHHFAEALAFDRPAGLLPSVAHKLSRRLQAESIGYLRKALSHYHLAGQQSGPAVDRWRQLAQIEAKMLDRVLRRTQKRP